MFSDLFLLFSTSETTIVSLLVTFTLSIFVVACVQYINMYLFRVLSLGITLIPLFWTLWLWYGYDASGQTFQFVSYIPGLHLSFGIDAVGLSLVLLTAALFPLCVLLMRTVSGIMTFLLLELVILGALLVLDLLGFYLLFEASLILLFLLVARPESLYGHQKNIHGLQRNSYGQIDAAYKIVLYTMAGSLVFLPIIFIFYSNYGTTNLLLLTLSGAEGYATSSPFSGNTLSQSYQFFLGWGMFFVFAVKLPLMPLHLWLPEAHVASPTAGSVLLAGVLLKLGGIGIIRFMIPLVPSFTVQIFPLIACMCLGSFLFSTLSTIRQVDLKKIVAYSSIAHMSLVTLAIFSMSEYSVYSSTFMMIAHGLVSPGLFLLVGLLYERSHTKFLLYFSGLGSALPVYSILFFLLTCANLSFPLFPNFIAEVLCLVSLFAVHSLYAYVFCAAQVLGAVYAFWAFNRVIHGYPSAVFYQKGFVTDLSRKELLMITPLMIGVFWLGLKPMA